MCEVIKRTARRVENPRPTSKRLRNKAQGCTVCGATLGKRPRHASTAKRLWPHFRRVPEPQPLRGWNPFAFDTQGSPLGSEQPWALRHNLFEVERQAVQTSHSHVKTCIGMKTHCLWGANGPDLCRSYGAWQVSVVNYYKHGAPLELGSGRHRSQLRRSGMFIVTGLKDSKPRRGGMAQIKIASSIMPAF